MFEEFSHFFKENKTIRVNDKGKEIPDKCPECGSDIKVYFHGEPVYLCSNKKCKKYFGTVPCNIQEASNEVYRSGGSIQKINDFRYTKLYFGSPKKQTNPMKLGRELFVTPFPGIASIFAVRPQDLKPYGVKPEDKINRGCDEWNLKYKDNILQRPLKELHVRLEGLSDMTPVKERVHGYIHEITVTPEIKDHIYRSDKMSQNDFEFCIDKLDKVSFSKIIEVDVIVHIRGTESCNKESE